MSYNVRPAERSGYFTHIWEWDDRPAHQTWHYYKLQRAALYMNFVGADGVPHHTTTPFGFITAALHIS